MQQTKTTMTRITQIVFLIGLIVTAILFWKTVRKAAGSATEHRAVAYACCRGSDRG